MLDWKLIADLITLCRAGIAVILGVIGWLQGMDGLFTAGWLMIVDWVGDVLDGAAARRSKSMRRTWLGNHDLEVDMLVSVGLLVFMVAAGLVSLAIAIIYVFLWMIIFWQQGLQRSPGMLFQAPIYGWFIWKTLQLEPVVGWSIIFYIALIVIITWPRFPNQVIPGFLDGLFRKPENHRG